MYICRYVYRYIGINAYPKPFGKILSNHLQNGASGEKSGIRKRSDEGRFSFYYIYTYIYSLFLKL